MSEQASHAAEPNHVRHPFFLAGRPDAAWCDDRYGGPCRFSEVPFSEVPEWG